MITKIKKKESPNSKKRTSNTTHIKEKLKGKKKGWKENKV